eukprot:scaffold3572_cov113-Cylindrotheca_fusiformis.AAC.2
MIKNDDRKRTSSLDQLDGSEKASGGPQLSINNYVLPGVDEAESLVAKAISSLSLEERSQLLDDVHGVSKPIDEKPDFISSSLTAFGAAVESSKTPLYEMALVQNASYVEDRSLRLMFLRSENFKVDAAVSRLMMFLKQKAFYFGEEKLTKEITLNDFSAEDMRSLESGAIQVLPKKDRSGRSVIAVFPRLRKFKDPKNLLRATFFVEMCTFRDVEVQKKGAVCIIYNNNPNPLGSVPNNRKGIIPLTVQHRAAMPVRYAAFHTCLFERKAFAPAGIALSSRKQDYATSKVHYGNDKECMLELRRFGIPTECIPVTSDGIIDLQPHQEWVKRKKTELRIRLLSDIASLEAGVRRLREPTSKNDSTKVRSLIQDAGRSEPMTAPRFQTTFLKALHRAADLAPNSLIQPTLTDVLLGRGRWFQEFPGNIAFRTYLGGKTNEYDRADKEGKNVLAKSIVRSFNASGTKFLRLSAPANGIPTWEEASFREVSKKVTQCYRSVRRKEKKHTCRLVKK